LPIKVIVENLRKIYCFLFTSHAMKLFVTVDYVRKNEFGVNLSIRPTEQH